MYFLPYNKNLKEFSRYLRNNSTLSEVLLWQELRAGQIQGYKFNRQKPLDRYIVDFYCKKLNLVIEVDGESHYHKDAQVRDKIRQEVLEKMGLSFLPQKYPPPQYKGECTLLTGDKWLLIYPPLRC